jgi:heat shock protein HslJ
MACSPEIMKRAAEYLEALKVSRAYRIADGQLQLLAADGALLAVLVPQTRALAGTAWRVTSVHQGTNAVVSVLAGSTLTLALAPDGRASGSTGCNRFTARYEIDEQQLRFLAPAATRMLCGREGLMEQEQAYLKALESVASARVEGNRLDLRDSKGALAISLVREGSAGAAGP